RERRWRSGGPSSRDPPTDAPSPPHARGPPTPSGAPSGTPPRPPLPRDGLAHEPLVRGRDPGGTHPRRLRPRGHALGRQADRGRRGGECRGGGSRLEPSPRPRRPGTRDRPRDGGTRPGRQPPGDPPRRSLRQRDERPAHAAGRDPRPPALRGSGLLRQAPAGATADREPGRPPRHPPPDRPAAPDPRLPARGPRGLQRVAAPDPRARDPSGLPGGDPLRGDQLFALLPVDAGAP